MIIPFENRELGRGLRGLEPHIRGLQRADYTARWEKLCEEYRYLLKFLREGYEDAERMALYKKMCKRGWHLANDVKRAEKIRENAGMTAMAKTIVEMSSGMVIERLRETQMRGAADTVHFDEVTRAFNFLMLGDDWKQQDSRLWTAYLLDQDTLADDVQTLVSALMLSCQVSFDYEKYSTMAYIYLTADDEKIRQRAFVGLVFCFHSVKGKPYSEDMCRLIVQIFEEEEARKSLTEMVMQVEHCNNALKDNHTIQQEIMPELIKGNPFQFSPEKGLVEREDDPMDEILNPGKSEKNMEKMEKNVNRMLNMQRQGADIFYSGFSVMKRYPFFYKMVNWFVPFSMLHPDVAGALQNKETMPILKKVCDNSAFCNSDKYSFLFAFNSVMPSMPEKMRGMMERGEIGPIGSLRDGMERDESAAYVRRIYLQDLYRFYNLCPVVKFDTPFTVEWLKPLLEVAGTLKSEAGDMLRFFIRHDMMGYAKMIYDCFEDAIADETELLGAYFIAKEEYHRAELYFDRLHKAYPENHSYTMNWLKCRITNGKVEDSMNEVYRLDFELEDNLRVKRLLAWSLMCAGKWEKAEALYRMILSGEYGDATSSDHLSFMDLLVIRGKAKEFAAVSEDYMDKYCKKIPANKRSRELRRVLVKEYGLLREYYKDFDLQLEMMVDAVR